MKPVVALTADQQRLPAENLPLVKYLLGNRAGEAAKKLGFQDATGWGRYFLCRAAAAYVPGTASRKTGKEIPFVYYSCYVVSRGLQRVMRSRVERTWQMTETGLEDAPARESEWRDADSDRDLVARVLRSLTARQRALIVEHYGIGCRPMTLREIAARDGTSRQAVSERLNRIRRRLARRFHRLKGSV